MNTRTWRLAVVCAERGIRSAAALRRAVCQQTTVALCDTTAEAYFHRTTVPQRLDTRVFCAILDTLGCAADEVMARTGGPGGESPAAMPGSGPSPTGSDAPVATGRKAADAPEFARPSEPPPARTPSGPEAAPSVQRLAARWAESTGDRSPHSRRRKGRRA
jgi:hypothetical protein